MENYAEKQKRTSVKKALPDTPEALLAVIAEISRGENLKVYAVGGYIRDRLLGREFSGEIDLSVVGDGIQFAETLRKKLNLRNRVQVYRRFGTARIQTGSIVLELATSRRESYSEDSRKPNVEPAPFEEDLARRDFTINTLAVEISEPDKIINLFDGLADLDNKIIRTPLDPCKTFSDDPLRMLRAIRFAAKLGFIIEKLTWEGIKREKRRLEIVSKERINDEFFKILASSPPSKGLSLLHDSGVLGVIFPDIEALSGVEQVGRHHHKDVLQHTLKVVDHLAEKTDRVDLLFAALLHDIGKPRTKYFDPDSGWTFHGHEHVGERMVKKMGKTYRLPEELVNKTSRLVRLHMRPINLNDEDVSDSAIRRLVVQAGDQIDDLLMLCRADITSANKVKVKRYIAEFDQMMQRMEEIDQKDQLRSFQSPIRGDEIMKRTGLPEGPRIGLIKTLIEEKILDGEIPNSVDGAEQIFDEIAGIVNDMKNAEVSRLLRTLMQERSDGIQS